jgi:hypothetical protein
VCLIPQAAFWPPVLLAVPTPSFSSHECELNCWRALAAGESLDIALAMCLSAGYVEKHQSLDIDQWQYAWDATSSSSLSCRIRSRYDGTLRVVARTCMFGRRMACVCACVRVCVSSAVSFLAPRGPGLAMTLDIAALKSNRRDSRNALG